MQFLSTGTTNDRAEAGFWLGLEGPGSYVCLLINKTKKPRDTQARQAFYCLTAKKVAVISSRNENSPSLCVLSQATNLGHFTASVEMYLLEEPY